MMKMPVHQLLWEALAPRDGAPNGADRVHAVNHFRVTVISATMHVGFAHYRQLHVFYGQCCCCTF